MIIEIPVWLVWFLVGAIGVSVVLDVVRIYYTRKQIEMQKLQSKLRI